MTNILKEVIDGIAEVLPDLTLEEPVTKEEMPVADPDFPNDLEPVIRADEVITLPDEPEVDRQATTETDPAANGERS